VFRVLQRNGNLPFARIVVIVLRPAMLVPAHVALLMEHPLHETVRLHLLRVRPLETVHQAVEIPGADWKAPAAVGAG